MGALVARHPQMLHVLADNHRQADPAERAVLEQLRAGNVGVAAEWYHQHGRIHAEADHDATLRGAVEGWAEDMAAGRNTALFAYQRGNVAELNRLAREVMVERGWVSGPELHGFAVGDRVIATAPVPGVMVNSERATVIAVNEAWGIIDLKADDGRLWPAYTATSSTGSPTGTPPRSTAPREPPSTPPTSLADGGGRELAYVAMSRARHTTQIYATADDAAMAVEDLTSDWNNERRPRWAIDTGLPATAAAPGHETELSQAQLASVLAIARHEQTGPDDERRRAAIQAELDRHRTTLPDVDSPEARQPPQPPQWPEPQWRYPTRDRGMDMGM